MEGTRIQILADMKSLLNARGGAHIVWIAGMAGTGKTSIALSLCRMLVKESTILLGGTFFCSRSAGAVERTDAQCIIPTLAAILARSVPAYASALAEELKKDPDLAHKSIGTQVEHLLARPLESVGSLGRQIIFVVDALDECSDEAKLVELIDRLASFTCAASVKFFLTSRPEMHIRDTAIADTSLSSIIHLHTIDASRVTADIRLYIQRTFEKAVTTSAWYTELDIDELAAMSGGLFIFASTALAYILRRKEVPGRSERLRTVKMQTSNSTLATASLDKMYSLVLSQASDPEAIEPTELDETRRIVAVILATRSPLTLDCLAKLLELSPEHLREALSGLHAVIFVPEEDDEGELRTLHASFGDYIFTRAPEHIRISKKLGHDELARGCLERMSAADLCFNISRRTSSYKANDPNDSDDYEDSEDSEDSKDSDDSDDSDDAGSSFSRSTRSSQASSYTRPRWVATSLVYACLHWAHHVNLASMRSSFDDKIDSVLRRKLLFWLELLSIIDEVGRASSLLRIAASAVSCCSTSTLPIPDLNLGSR